MDAQREKFVGRWFRVLIWLLVTIHNSQSLTTFLVRARTSPTLPVIGLTPANGRIGVSASWAGAGGGVTVGKCEFPSEWQYGKQWWCGYVTDNATLSVEGLNYVYETFGKDSVSSFEMRSPFKAKNIWRCVGAGWRGSSRTHVYVMVDAANNIDCREYAEQGGVLLLRWIFSGRAKGRVTTVEQCANRLGSMTSYEVLPQFNPLTSEISVRDCPIAEGVYSTEIVEQTESGAQTYCKDRPDSLTTISKAQMDIQSCRRLDTFDKPYYSYMYCVSSWSGKVLGGKFGQAAARDKTVLLLYQNKNTNVRPHFYIGRYRTSENGGVQLSLYVGDTRKITGVLTATADERSVAYRNFVFTRTGDVPADPNSNSQDGVLLTDNPAADHCMGGCLNGICEQNSGIWQCVCKHGYGGKSCERVLRVGSCAKSPCEKGVCEQHRDYYHCRCAEGYIGPNCESPEYCVPNPCSRGVCEYFEGGYRCLCPDGYSGRSCAVNVVAEVDEDRKVLIVLTTLLSFFVIGVVVIAIVICQCKRKHEEKSLPANPDGELPNQTYSSMTSWFPDYKREMAVSEVTASP